MDNYNKLLELFDDKSKTQLMKQEINLYGLKYIKIYETLLLHSYFEKNDLKSLNPVFAAPAMLHSIDLSDKIPVLTIKTLQDGLDPLGISMVKSLRPDEIEVAYSNLAEEILTPKIDKNGWDNWVFSYSVPVEEKFRLRKQRTKITASKLYRGLKSLDFDNKKILFLGFGDGIEIETLINYFNIKNADIWGIEQSKVAFADSQTLKTKFPNIKFNLHRLDFEEIGDLPEKDFDYIIAIGFFDRETLTELQGRDFLKLIKSNLTYKKFATIAYTFDLFAKTDFEKLGFKVISSSVPQSMYTNDYSLFYLME